jgi:hypothetical protein
MMQPLPSPKYHELRTDADPEDRKKHDTDDDKAKSFFEDEERAWSDITAGDPGMAQRRLSRRRRIWMALMSIRSLLDTVLLLVILGLLLERGWQRTAWFEIGGDITGFAPRSTDMSSNCIPHGLLLTRGTVSQQIKSFVPNPLFIPKNGSEFFTDAVRSRWLSIVPSKFFSNYPVNFD